MIAAASLLPIAPLILLPFAIVFFVLVFPFWLIGIAVLWTVYQLVRLVSGGPQSKPAMRVHGWFRWVLTFGGFTDKVMPAAPRDQSR